MGSYRYGKRNERRWILVRSGKTYNLKIMWNRSEMNLHKLKPRI